LTHPLKLGIKTSTCSTLCISSYQILTTTWKQIIITQVLPLSMAIITFQSYASVTFLMMGLTHQRFNCMARCLTKKCHTGQDNAEMS
jgi:hypothetical protein